MADERSGIKTAIAEVAEAVNATQPEAPSQQLPMFPLPIVADELGEGVVTDVPTAPRGPGRPPGARNKSTEEWRQLFLTKFRSPMFAAGEIYSRSVQQLAVDLGLRWEALTFDQRVELLKIQRDCALGVLPYVHSKQPLAVQVDGKGIVQVILAPIEDKPATIIDGQSDQVVIEDKSA